MLSLAAAVSCSSVFNAVLIRDSFLVANEEPQTSSRCNCYILFYSQPLGSLNSLEHY